ncbi:SusC/RagA family TonB-linked outer membrane protein [Puia dinghuensis]|nr:SusC/RagA family TonB-linked outer membrane protein [Puia dinghuensis]
MRKLLSQLLCLCMAVIQLEGQTPSVPINGSVTDEKGAPLAAVTITALTPDRKVVATTVTDVAGVFHLNISNKVRALQFSYIGLEEQLVPVGNKTSFSVTLHASNKNLSEVVVVGYGTQRKTEVTGSITTVKGSALSETPIQSFESGLAGRSAGVQITQASGVANEPPVFRVRGTNSISLSSYPLIVVDGVPSYTGDFNNPAGTELTSASANPLASINPSDIESIDIAKDPAATAIYGSRAANGVVFITTKKGKAGRVKVTYDGWVGQVKAYGLPQMLNADQYIAFKSQAVANNPTLNNVTFNYAKDKNGNNVNTKWFDYIYRTGTSHSHNLSISGGSDATTYYLSGGFTKQEGIIRRNDFSRANILTNIDSRVNKWLTIGGKVSYSDEQNLSAASSGSLPGEAFNTVGLGRIGEVLPSILPAYNNDGSYNINGASIGYANITGTAISYYNPVPILDLSRSNNEVSHLQSNVYAQIKPLSWITLKSIYAVDNLWVDVDNFSTPITGDGYAATGSASSILGKYKEWVWTNTAQFDHTFGDDHNFTLLVGNEQTRRTSEGYGLNRTTLSDPAYTEIQAGFTINNYTGLQLGQNYLLSTFGRLNYNYAHKYYLVGTLRQDEYSAFGKKKGIFGGGSVGWEVAQEDFWKNSGIGHIFNSFKIRGSYGKVGNNGGISDFAPYSLYGSGVYGGLATLSFPLGSVGNPIIQWETSTQTDVGFNVGILHDRITGQFAYYNNNINHLILAVSQAPSTGLPTAPNLNIGSMYNRGIEATINAVPVQKKDFTWTTSFNVTYNENKVTGLAPGLTAVQTGTSGLETVNQTKVGYSEGYLWVVRTAGVDPGTGKRIFVNSANTKVYFNLLGSPQYTTDAAGTVKYVSPTGATSISQAADAVMYKNALPRYVGGWSNNFAYKGFSLDVLLTYQAGFYVYYGTNAGLHDQRFWNNAADVLTDAWSAKSTNNAKYAKPIFGDNVSNGSTLPLDINVFKGDFIKLRNVTLSYTVPPVVMQRIGLTSARVYISGQNLGISTKYPGPDPEVSSNGNSNGGQGVDRNTVANARTFLVGLNVGF